MAVLQTTINGLSVSYTTQGEGEVVLLLHGWGASASTYRLIIDHLSARFRVIAPDLPGFGGSAEPPVPWGADDYADFVSAFAVFLDIKEAALIGHSNGGRVIIKLLARRPCPLNVKQAVLIDSAGIKPKHGPGYYLRVYSFKVFKAVMNTKPLKALFPNAIANARKKLGSSDYKQASPLMQQTMVKLLSEDLTSYLPQIAASTLLIWGEKDDATPLSDGQLMEKRIPDAGLVVLKGGGHFAFAEQWGLCAAVLDSFLK